MKCDQIENIARYFDAELGAAERAAVEAHLQICLACQGELAALRELSQSISEAPLPAMSASTLNRYYAVWDRTGRSGVLRIASWLSGIAAAVLVAGLLWPARMVPAPPPQQASRPIAWEAVALMPSMTPEAGGERADDQVQMAQWMADDLAEGAAGGH